MIVSRLKQLLLAREGEFPLPPVPYKIKEETASAADGVARSQVQGEGDARRSSPARRKRFAVVEHGGRMLELSVAQLYTMLICHAASALHKRHEDEAPPSPATTGPAHTCLCVGVPSYLSASKVRELSLAVQAAECLLPLSAWLLDEGTATALAYGMLSLPSERPLPVTVAFVDVGYFATQVTVARFSEEGVQVLGRSARVGCGVGGVEGRLMAHLCETLQEREGVDLTSPFADVRLVQRLAVAVAAAVKTLSANAETWVTLQSVRGAEEPKDVHLPVTRSELEAACCDVRDGIMHACRDAMRSLKEDGDGVVVELLGGGTYIPFVQRALESLVGEDRVLKSMNRAESVASGLALAAARMSASYRLRPYKLTDRLVRPLRISWMWEGSDGMVAQGSSDIPEGTEVPCLHAVPVPLPCVEGSAPPEGELRVEIWGGEGALFSRATVASRKEERSAVADPAQAYHICVEVGLDPLEPPRVASAALQAVPLSDREEGEESGGEPLAVRQESLSAVETGDDAGSAIALLERQLQAEDGLARAAAEARNALEDAVYSLRSRLREDLHPFVTEQEAATALGRLEDVEDWVRDEGDRAATEEVLDKLAEVAKMGSRPEERKEVHTKVCAALDALQQCMLSIEQQWREGDGAQDEGKSRKMERELADVQHWLTPLQEWGADSSPSSPAGYLIGKPSVSVAEAHKKMERLKKTSERIMGPSSSAAPSEQAQAGAP
jgi:molecular chaperone DnaK (HSP70)